MKHAKKLFLCLIAFMAIFTMLSCENSLPEETTERYESEDLEGWKLAWLDNIGKESGKIDIQVKGTVLTVNGNMTYLTDGSETIMPIYKLSKSKDFENVVEGQILTVEAKEIKNFHEFYEATSAKIIKQEAGAVEEPTLLLDAEVLKSYKDLNYGKLTMYGQVLEQDKDQPTFTIRILTKEKYDELCKEDAYLKAELNPTNKENSITVMPKAGTLYAGDILQLTGHYQPFDDNWQLNAFNFDGWKKVPRPSVAKTIQDWKNLEPEKYGTVSITPGYQLSGIASKHGSEIILIDPTTKETMSFYNSTAAKTLNKTGSKITIDARNLVKSKHGIQCESFEIKSQEAVEGAPHNLAIEINDTETFTSKAMEGKNYYVKMNVKVTKAKENKNIRIQPTFDAEIHDQSCYVGSADYAIDTELEAYCVLTIYTSKEGKQSASFKALEVKKPTTV